MPYSEITCAVADHIATVTLNRPDKLNALSTDVVTELDDAFERIARDASLRAGIVTGARRASSAWVRATGLRPT